MTKATSSRFDLSEVELSSKVTVRRYREMETAKDRQGSARFIKERLLERYVDPLETAKKKHGFLMVAAACLLIETLESFYRGWLDTDERIQRGDIEDPCKPADPARSRVSRGEAAFCYFFHREPAFVPFRPYAHDFYVCVRCGILHQGETTGGWRIRREGHLLDDRTINASKFLEAVERAVSKYAATLWNTDDWEDIVWKNFRKKMDAIILHCKP